MKPITIALALVATVCFAGNALAIGPAPPGSAIAEYYPDSGQIKIANSGVNNWFVESLSSSLTGASPIFNIGGLQTDNDSKIGLSDIFILPNTTNWDLGLVAATGIGEGDLFITSTAGLSEPAITIPVNVIPEPTSLALAGLGLSLVVLRRRRNTV